VPSEPVGRRAFLAIVASSGAALAACSSSGSQSPPARTGKDAAVTPKKIFYGTDAAQFGELSIPDEKVHAGTVVIIHGGFWRAQYDLSLGRPLAADLAARGYTVWNLEYRRVGDGGGWPATLQDVADGIDHLATLTTDPGIDVSKVVAVGHSAGGQLAVWAAGRSALPAGAPGAGPQVQLTSVVSQAGVVDLAVAANTGVGGSAESDFLGGSPAAVPERYAIADPIQRLPISAPVLCVHSKGDQNVPYSQSTAYVAAATKAGDPAALHEVSGDHFTLIDPTSQAWAVVVDALPDLLAGHLPS
jgi:acetyl esterase/lipase